MPCVSQPTSRNSVPLSSLSRPTPKGKITPADPKLFDEGVKLFESRSDKEWSLTDCISFVVMQREGIAEALTGDHHFEQAGFVALLK
jgi:predicted nucleic acid-binding protein